MEVGFLAHIAIEYIKFGKHVAEVFSPPRVTSTASKIGLRAGFALDLTQVEGETGKPWDFNDPEMRNRALKLVDEQSQFCWWDVHRAGHSLVCLKLMRVG